MGTRIFLSSVLVAAASGCATVSQGDPPHLDRVELRRSVQRYETFYPTFYFHAPDGDVVEVRREIIAASGDNPNFNPASRIHIDADAQRRGAVWVGGWGCGPNASTTTVRAYLVDRRGRRSNPVDYTIVCKGAAELFKAPG